MLLVTKAKFGLSWNCAVTEVAADIGTTQGPAPEQAPVQPTKFESLETMLFSATAVRLTIVPELKRPTQTPPSGEQLLMPVGLELMVPNPLPEKKTLSWMGSNFAVTVYAWLMVTTQVPEPEQPPPLQPEKVELGLGIAVRVTTVL